MNGSYKPLPAADELWELFSYNPLTGNLHWRERRGGKAKKGDRAGHAHANKRYIRVRVDNESYLAHRLVWGWLYGEDPGQQMMDHINGTKRDNRPWNLRLATKSQNQWNTAAPSTNTSGYKGVTWHRATARWTARIRCEGKKKHLGLYNTPEEAHQAYCKAAKRIHGNFARLR